jgi:hypothetical protein
MRTIICIIVLILINTQNYCQDLDILQKNHQQLENSILRKFRKLRCYDKKEDYSILFIDYYNFKTNPSQAIFNDSLIFKLDIIKTNDNNCTESIIYNDSLKVVGTSDEFYAYVHSKRI